MISDLVIQEVSLRLSKGMSSRKIAKECRVGHTTIAKIRNGIVNQPNITYSQFQAEVLISFFDKVMSGLGNLETLVPNLVQELQTNPVLTQLIDRIKANQKPKEDK